MTPIERLLKSFVGLVSDIVGVFFNAFENMDMIQLATVSICVLVIAAMCLRGNPVRGA